MERQDLRLESDLARDPGLLTICLKDDRGHSRLGQCRISDETLQFEPKYPLEPGLTYRATLNLDGRPAISQDLILPRHPSRPPARVIGVSPTGELLPENLLKFYVTFSSPMARGEEYTHVKILDGDGRPLVLPIFELGEGLWDPTGPLLTLFLDLERVKRGLVPREEEGPILVAGRSYTLIIRKDWPDANGEALAEPFRKPFRATDADEVSPTLASWTLTAPRLGALELLSILFPKPLDDALLRSAFKVETGEDHRIEGVIKVDRGKHRWRFRPKQAWTSENYRVVVEAILEDRSGNNFLHPFEVDVAHFATNLGKSKAFQLPFRASASNH